METTKRQWTTEFVHLTRTLASQCFPSQYPTRRKQEAERVPKKYHNLKGANSYTHKHHWPLQEEDETAAGTLRSYSTRPGSATSTEVKNRNSSLDWKSNLPVYRRPADRRTPRIPKRMSIRKRLRRPVPPQPATTMATGGGSPSSPSVKRRRPWDRDRSEGFESHQRRSAEREREGTKGAREGTGKSKINIYFWPPQNFFWVAKFLFTNKI